MNIKEAVEYIANEKGIDSITGAIEYNWKLYQPCFRLIENELNIFRDLAKKDTPVEAKLNGDYSKLYFLSCPKCEAIVSKSRPDCWYCWNCGQKLYYNGLPKNEKI